MAEHSRKAEAEIQRNPHRDFKAVERSRPAWDSESQFRFTQTPAPDWKFGDGANDETLASPSSKHVPIDPYEDGRPAVFNYKLLISAIVPRPIAFVSTRSSDGKVTNLAPFSYFQMIAHNPPMFVVGFATPLEQSGRSRDTLRCLVESGECTVNIISEGFVEAANACAVDTPFGQTEWAVSGLTPEYDCQTVKCARVRESIFTVEAKLDTVREIESRVEPGKKTGTMVTLEGTRFWAREDALNSDRNLLDPAVLRPMSRLGGITYGRTTEAIEIPRPRYGEDVGGEEGFGRLADKHKNNGTNDAA